MSAAQQALTEWVDSVLPPGSALGVGGQLNDGTGFQRGSAAAYTACGSDKVWTAIGPVAQLVGATGGSPTSMWVFETALLWLACRSDGAWLGIFTSRDLDADARNSVKSLLETFAVGS